MSQLRPTSDLLKVTSIALALLLVGCSKDSSYKRQVSGNEDYLQASPLRPLKTPAGIILPVQHGDYEIPPVTSTGPVGKALDIRPPTQALALASGSRTQFAGNTATLYLTGNGGGSLWNQVAGIVTGQGRQIASRQDAQQTLTTDWISWPRSDEEQPYQGRYQISLQQQGPQTALISKLLELRQGEKVTTQATEIQRYNMQMLNLISAGLDKKQSRTATGGVTESSDLSVQSGSDETGLPLLIIRTAYPLVWERLPGALNQIGMEISDSSRNQGKLDIKYSNPGADTWRKLGVKAPTLDDGEYKLQLGDLENRSSLQFISGKGQVLTQAQNDSLVKVLQAAFNQSKTKK